LEAQLLSEFDGKSALAAEPDQHRVLCFSRHMRTSLPTQRG
jgi:hypothetical protein